MQDVYQQQTQETSPQSNVSADDKEKALTYDNNNRTYSLVDFEAFQKMPLNNLSNRSAHWDPKVFRKIAQLIDPPKSPSETPQGGSNYNSRPNSPEEKKLESMNYNLLTTFSVKIFKIYYIIK